MKCQLWALFLATAGLGCTAHHLAAGTVYHRPANMLEGVAVPTVSETTADSLAVFAGVTVTCVRCDPSSVVTGSDGAFSLVVPEGAVPVVLSFQAAGYQPVRIEAQVNEVTGQVRFEPFAVFLTSE